MGNLTRLIELYETKGVAEVLKEERLWKDLEELRKDLDAQDPKDREALEARFNALLTDLARNEQELTSQMKIALDQIEGSNKNAEACLSYTRGAVRHKTGRQKGS